MFDDDSDKKGALTYNMDTLTNKTLSDVKKELEDNNLNVVVIGNGDRIINQYPKKGTLLVENDRVFLITNGSEYTMPDITNWSRYDVVKLCEFMNIECSFEGYGYVTSQSIKKGNKIDENSKLDVLLGKKN